MHKSILTFALLASSLVMLSAMPLFNNNSFSNTAMAQEYDKYGDSSYSKYPTDDNKYECWTGPLEGFFVSSVEFCKHVKFDKDDRKDNRTGTQVLKVLKVLQARQVHKVYKVNEALMELKVYKEFREFTVYKVYLVLR